MDAQFYRGITSVDPAVWGKITQGQPYAGWDWCRYGEVVTGSLGYYVIVSNGGEPIGGALLTLLHQEQLPVEQRIVRSLLERYLFHRPLLICRTPAQTKYHAIFLPPDHEEREQALALIQRVAQQIAHQQHASFVLFDYLPEAEIVLGWADFVKLENYADVGTRLSLPWNSFDDYLAALRERSKSAHQDYRRHTKRAQALGIRVAVERQVTRLDEAMLLIRNVEQAYRQPPYPFTRQILENASLAPDGAWITADIDGRMVACGLLLNDRENGICTPVLYGRDYSVEYAYFCTYYEVIRFAIEKLHAQLLIGESGAYEFKQRLGFAPDQRNNLVFASSSRVGQKLVAGLARLIS